MMTAITTNSRIGETIGIGIGLHAVGAVTPSLVLARQLRPSEADTAGVPAAVTTASSPRTPAQVPVRADSPRQAGGGIEPTPKQRTPVSRSPAYVMEPRGEVPVRASKVYVTVGLPGPTASREPDRPTRTRMHCVPLVSSLGFSAYAATVTDEPSLIRRSRL